MILGFTKIFVDDNGKPINQETQWIADAFVLFGFVIYIGKIRNRGEHL